METNTDIVVGRDPPSNQKDRTVIVDEAASSTTMEHRQGPSRKKRLLGIIWDSFDKPPEERKFMAKIDWWILTYCCVAYFVKYLDQTNVSDDPSVVHLKEYPNMNSFL